ncbi:hypothetical protein CalGV061 [Clostera anastomosis granulovirus A]|uniref:Uncharacterized protein n=1 Tax=Clostera anastomosis granulovirus A TaxID=1986289 RepID=U5KBU5_9BBAC|nr:hypothetical protein CalGV061 [Clostera anastomosis granulovirus Henan]AGQ20319.1 hypothetical protein CalGV061 [Clostera anastomosis granulovirus Henan]
MQLVAYMLSFRSDTHCDLDMVDYVLQHYFVCKYCVHHANISIAVCEDRANLEYFNGFITSPYNDVWRVSILELCDVVKLNVLVNKCSVEIL